MPPAARYDLPWKAAIRHTLRGFIALFFPDLRARVDWSRPPRSRDKELAAIGFGAAANSMTADTLVEVRLRDSSAPSLLVHIEVQAQHDTALANRMLDYNYRIHKEHAQPVLSLVLLADEDAGWRPCEHRREVFGFGTRFTFATAKLQDYAARADELLASHNPIALVALAHLRTQQHRHDPDALYQARWQLTRSLYQHGWSKTRIIVLFKVINWMMVLPEQYRERYWQAIYKLEKERKMEWITPLEQWSVNKGLKEGLEKGLKLGLEQGLEQGRKQEAAAQLERQLSRRFGELSKTTRNKLAKASLPQLRVWVDAVPEATTLKQVFEQRP